MKNLIFLLLLFAISCTTSREQKIDISPTDTDDAVKSAPISPIWHLEPDLNKIGRLENGRLTAYHEISDNRNCCPNMAYLGHGTIHSINGVMQDDTAHYHFFWPKQTSEKIFESKSRVNNSLADVDVEYDYFYYSYANEVMIQRSRKLSGSYKTPLKYVDGVMYTCRCSPAHIDTFYRAKFPDVTLVKKVPKGQADHLIKTVD